MQFLFGDGARMYVFNLRVLGFSSRTVGIRFSFRFCDGDPLFSVRWRREMAAMVEAEVGACDRVRAEAEAGGHATGGGGGGSSGRLP